MLEVAAGAIEGGNAFTADLIFLFEQPKTNKLVPARLVKRFAVDILSRRLHVRRLGYVEFVPDIMIDIPEVSPVGIEERDRIVVELAEHLEEAFAAKNVGLVTLEAFAHRRDDLLDTLFGERTAGLIPSFLDQLDLGRVPDDFAAQLLVERIHANRKRAQIGDDTVGALPWNDRGQNLAEGATCERHSADDRASCRDEPVAQRIVETIRRTIVRHRHSLLLSLPDRIYAADIRTAQSPLASTQTSRQTALMIVHMADSNVLRQPALIEYLRASKNHYIAISDWTLNEMQKRNALSTSRESLRVVALYPDQICLLRPTHELLDDKVASSDDATALFDHQATLELIALARDLRQVPQPPHLARRMEEAEDYAAEMMKRLKAEVAEFEPGLVDAAAQFSDAELMMMRRPGEGPPDALRRKLLDLLLVTTGSFMLDNQVGQTKSPMKVSEAMKMFGFRYSLCTTVYYLEWVRIGRQTGLKVDLRVNDVIDMQVAAVGTFFCGVFSLDKKLQAISQTTRRILRHWGAYVGEDWSPPAPPV